MAEKLPKDVQEILQKVSEEEKISSPTLTFHERNEKGEGYMGEMFFVTIQDEKSAKKLEVVVKKAHSTKIIRSNFPIEKMYWNECLFYKKIWPVFVEYQKSLKGTQFFNEVPKCYATVMEINKEKLVLENLKFSQFEMMNKRLFFDKEHFEFIFKVYGKLHAVSFAFKTEHPRIFHEMSCGFHDYWEGLEKIKILTDAIKLMIQQCAQYVTLDFNSEVVKKIQKYAEGKLEVFSNSSKYKGENSVILHGDCWSNNMMFKYDESRRLRDVRFLDFQLAKLGTPVFDLSYCLYSGGSKDMFDELDHYLKVYHDALSDSLRQFNCDPEEIYPFKTLKGEWKVYSKFGFILGLLLLKVKLVHDNEGMDIAEIIKNSNDMEDIEMGKYNESELQERSLDLIRHMNVNGFL